MTTTLDALYRAHAAQLIARLSRVAGGRVDQAEAAVHDAFVAASKAFAKEIPTRPEAWLYRVAHNRLIDAARRARTRLHATPPAPDAVDPPVAIFSGEWDDELLRMIVTTCQPSLTPDEQVAFALRILCGLERASIAELFRASEETIKKRLTRARAKLRVAAELEGPQPALARERVPAALRVLYLVFTEGHKPRSGAEATRFELCVEAIRLTAVLQRQVPDQGPAIEALLALMKLTLARAPARDGRSPTLLEDQDRGLWDARLIDEGLAHLRQSAQGAEQTTYHLEAAIAACHCLAPSFAETDWPRIVGFYDALIALQPSTVYALNRAIALGFAEGPEAGLVALRALPHDEVVAWLPYQAALGALYDRAGQTDAAAAAWRAARDLSRTDADRAFFTARLEGRAGRARG